MDIENMHRCVAFFNGRPDEWKAYEGEGRCGKCERNLQSVCVDDMRGGPHYCVATIHAPGEESDAAHLAAMVAWQIELFASPKNARAVLASLRAAGKMASAIEAYDAASERALSDETASDEAAALVAAIESAIRFRKAMRGEL